MRPRRKWTIGIALCVLVLVVAPTFGWGAYAAGTWLSFGRASPHPGSDPLMQRYMPRYDIAEVHQTRVAAPPSVTWDAARTMDLHRSGVIHAIFRGREIMLRASAAERPEMPLVDELQSIGWGVLEEVRGRQLVFGAVTQPWEADVVFRSLPPSTYVAFDSAGYVKLVVTIAVDSLGPHESIFRTETRALATDAEARARFRRYWATFSPGILLIRSQALSLVRSEAERQPAR